MDFDKQRALELLRLETANPSAKFRDDQATAVQHVIEERGRLLVVQKTGWGKSSVYFIATKILREAGTGPALLISPLIALMRNQIEAARRMGLRAETIHSDNRSHWASVQSNVVKDEVDLLLISPERLANEDFVDQVLPMGTENCRAAARYPGHFRRTSKTSSRRSKLLLSMQKDSHQTLICPCSPCKNIEALLRREL